MLKRLLLGGLAGSVCFPVPSLAQEKDSVRVPLPAITVDALRSGLGLDRAPVSLTVLNAPRVTAGSGASLDEVLRTIPGLQLDNRHNQALGERLSIRGFGARSGFGVRGVRVLLDGIPATMPDGQTTLNHVDPAQIVAIEAVRGPAAAFLGNAAGGALLLRTARRPGVTASATTGAAGLRRLDATLGSASAGGYAAWQRQTGFREYSRWERAVFGATGALAAGAGRVELAAHGVHYDARNPGALTRAQLEADPTQASANNVRQRTGEEGTHAQVGAGWLSPLGRYHLELRVHAGGRTLDNPIPPRVIELDRRFGGARVQLSRSLSRLRVAAGVEAELQRDERLNYLNEEGYRGALVLDQEERVRGLGAFGHARWSPADAVLFFAAARFDRYRFAVDDHLPADADDAGTRILGATTGTFGVTLRAGEGVELFANVGTAFETPTTTELANSPGGAGGFNPELQPEQTRAAEAGLRAGSRRLSGEITVFRADVRDKLIPYEVEGVPGRQFYRNAGSARHQGIEALLELSPHDDVVLRGTYARLDARFRDYEVGGKDYAGARVPGAAGHQLDAALIVKLAPGFRLRGDVRRAGRVAVNDANDAHAAAYTLAGARIAHDGVRLGRLRIETYAGVDNAVDVNYTAAVSVNAFGGRYYEPGPGRSIYLGIRLGAR